MRIEQVSTQPDMAGRYKVTFSDGTTLRLYKQTVQDFGIYNGRELTQEQWNALQTAEREMSARMRAVRIVSAGNVSKEELTKRLVQKGEDPQFSRQAVYWLAELDLIDDGKTAEQIVAQCIAKGYGLARAKQALYEKRIPKEYWQEALADYPEQLDAIASYVQSHLRDSKDPKARKKVIDALIRRGHSYSAIRKVIEPWDWTED